MFDFNQWIAENGLSEYKGLFEKHQLTTAETLQSLTSDDLSRMGIELIGVQKKILQARNMLFSKKRGGGLCPFTQCACTPACELFTVIAMMSDGKKIFGCALYSPLFIQDGLERVENLVNDISINVDLLPEKLM